MFKKGFLGLLFVGLIAALVYGAINRTMDKTEDSVEASEYGRGRNATMATSHAEEEFAPSQVGYNGQGRGRQESQSEAEHDKAVRSYPNYQEPEAEWLVYEGAITQLPDSGVDMMIATADGEIVVGVGPVDLDELGLVLQAGEQIRIQGYWEDNEFKAAQLTQISTGETLVIRDDQGRGIWSGSAQASNGQGSSGQGGRGQGSSGQGGSGWGGNGRDSSGLDDAGHGNADRDDAGSNDISGNDTAGAGQAQVDAWITIQGVVSSVDESELVVDNDGELIVIANRPWWFAQEQGFSATPGDEITLIGFYEESAFEVGELINNSTGESVLIRQESGRPLWAGPQRG